METEDSYFQDKRLDYDSSDEYSVKEQIYQIIGEPDQNTPIFDNLKAIKLEPQKKQIKHQKPYSYNNFEQYRNNTSFFEHNKKWLDKVYTHYQKSLAHKVLQKHQFETVMYMSGQFMNGVHPRGLLLFQTMGIGKTITNIASGFYCLSSLKIYTDKSKLIFICNKSLQAQLQKEIIKYINILNKHKINQQFQRTENYLIPEYFLEKCQFITFNDSFSLDDNLINKIDILSNNFVVFDEVHNLFKSIINDSERGNVVYQQLISNKLQLQFNSGTPFSSDLKELSICFNILSGNPKLFPIDSMDQLFIKQSVESDDKLYIQNKQVLIRRLTGLISSAEINVDSQDFPKLNELQVIQVPIAKEYYEIYINSRKQNLKSSKFMSESHLLDNSYISVEGQIISEKFNKIKEQIELDIKPQIIYSQYVKRGTISFCDYCIEQNKTSKITWRQFGLESQTRQSNEVVFALIHGLISIEERSRLINIFNSPANLNGDIITLLCLSKASVEGINIKYVRKVHIMEAQWESRDIQQVISRGQRMFSHSLLPFEQRVVTPYIYLSYITDPKYAFIKDIKHMSTDQQIYYKQQSLITFQNTIYTLLQFASFNCYSLTQFAFLDQLFKPEFHKACFSCEADNKQLFNPDFIHQDIITNNCRKPTIQTTTIQFEHNKQIYAVSIDIYATFGFIIYDARDKFKQPIKEENTEFKVIFEKAKLAINNYSKNKISAQSINEFIPDISLNMEQHQQVIFLSSQSDLNQLQLSKQQQDDIIELQNLILPSNQTFSENILFQFLKSYHHLHYQSISSKTKNNGTYMFWDILSIFKDNLLQRQSVNNIKIVKKFKLDDFKTSTYILNQIQLNHIEFTNKIISPFYKFLIEYINVQARHKIELYFQNYMQLYLIQQNNPLSKIERKLIRDVIKYFVQ